MKFDFSLTKKTLIRKGFILMSTERTQILSKVGTRDFFYSLPFKGSECFHVTTTGNFERFHYFNKAILKNGKNVF